MEKQFSLFNKIKFYANQFRIELLIIPAIYGFLSFYGLSQNKFFFTTYPDSIYIYLINGTNIAAGNFAIGHYDNPGTPVHLLAGLIIKITHLFAGNEGNVYKDVFANPEFYLNVCVRVMLVLLLTSVYVTAKFVYQHTQNITLAFLFQLLPICSFFTIHYLLLIRICPENLIILCLVYYYAFLFVMSYLREKNLTINNKEHIVIFSFISALLLTTKMTCLPLLIFPLFYIGKLQKKIVYLILTLLFALIILIPVWDRFREMYHWFTGLATRSGNYGQGKGGINVEELFSNMSALLHHEYFFAIGYIILSVSVIIGFMKRKWNNYFFKFTLASFIVCTSQLILASKQFGFHYLIPSQLLIIPGYISVFKTYSFKLNEKYFLIILFLVCAAWFSFKTNQSLNGTKQENYIYQSFISSKKYSNIPKIITTGYQGSCFNESALRFGASYGGPSFHYPNYILKRVYPNSFFYDLHLSENTVDWWDIKYTTLEFFQSHSQAIVYFIRMDKESEMKMINKLVNGFEDAVKEIKVLEFNPLTNERFYSVVIDENKLNLTYYTKEKIVFDFENTTNDKSFFLTDDKKNSIGGVEFSSTQKSFSKNKSILIPRDAYACCTTLVVGPGDLVDISVKCISPDRPVGITISASSNPEIFNKASEAIVDEPGNDWKKINLHTIIPLNCSVKNMNFCLFYWGKKQCYVDDLEITIFKNSAAIPPNSSLIIGKRFILKTSENKFLSINKDSVVAANATEKSDAEIFEAIEMGNGKIALKTIKGKFVCADRNQRNEIVANRNSAFEWETFEVKIVNNNKIILKSSNGSFVGLPDNKTNIISANSQKGELFEFIEM